MSERAKEPIKTLFQVNLDHLITTLPGKSLRSMLGMLAHLENLAARREKEGMGGSRRSRATHSQPLFPNNRPFDGAGGTSFRELGRQFLRTARTQVRVLQSRNQEAQSLVLINTWAVSERLWSELQADCKTPLFEVSFLEDLWGLNPELIEVEGWSLSRQWHEFVLIQAEIEILLARRQSLVDLSDALDVRLGHWLKRFGEILEKLDEESAV